MRHFHREFHDPQGIHPLCHLPTGSSVIVKELHGGRSFTARLAALGITIGTNLSIVQNYGRGPIIVSVLGTRLALGRFEAHKIHVEVL